MNVHIFAGFVRYDMYSTVYIVLYITSLLSTVEKLACAYHGGDICECSPSKKVLRYIQFIHKLNTQLSVH